MENEIRAYGLRLPLSKHKEVRKLKKRFKPSYFGSSVWESSWLLIDYIKQTKLISRHKVLDIGCGWGLSGIYCAKKYHASVTGVDMDGDVYPYVKLLADINKVNMDFLNLEFNQVKSNVLKGVDIMIGSDICFYGSLIDPLRRLIQRAKRSSVGLILIADPGRTTFNDLVQLFIGKKGVELLHRRISKPQAFSGEILKLDLSS